MARFMKVLAIVTAGLEAALSIILWLFSIFESSFSYSPESSVYGWVILILGLLSAGTSYGIFMSISTVLDNQEHSLAQQRDITVLLTQLVDERRHSARLSPHLPVQQQRRPSPPRPLRPPFPPKPPYLPMTPFHPSIQATPSNPTQKTARSNAPFAANCKGLDASCALNAAHHSSNRQAPDIPPLLSATEPA